MIRIWMLAFIVAPAAALPTPEMCAKFAKFVERWNPIPETLLSWSKDNCDKIQPRPKDMTCSDVQRFIADCNYGGGGPARGGGGQAGGDGEPTEGKVLALNRASLENYYQNTYGNSPQVLGRYIYYNAATVTDYGQFGNWYYPNYYPPTYLGYFDGRADSIAQLENDYRFAKGGHYRYNRADNIVNIGLQQTYLPTCLHDLFYCVRGSKPSPYQQYYAQREEHSKKSQAQDSYASEENRIK